MPSNKMVHAWVTQDDFRGGARGGSLEPPSQPPFFKYPIKMK